jgi:hypothetical protein
LDLKDSPKNVISDAVLLDYSSWPNIFRSWFWRYYDHLGHLILYNLGWFISCFTIGWLVLHYDLVGSIEQINLLGLYLLFLLEAAVSIGWAYLVFNVFNSGEESWSNIFRGFRRYFWKAMGISALSGLVIGFALYNIHFYFFMNSSHRFLDFMFMGIVFWMLLFWLSAALYQWPILFFQNPPFLKIFYRSWLLALANSFVSLGILIFFTICFCLFSLSVVPWFFLGITYFFSFQCVALEKHFLRHKIIYGDNSIEAFLEILERERQRGWRDFLRPWENR